MLPYSDARLGFGALTVRMVQVRQVPLEAIVLKNEAPGMDSALRIQIYPKKRDFPYNHILGMGF